MNALLLKGAIAVVVALALGFGWSKLTHHYDSHGYERAKAEDREAAREQAERNRQLQRAAELRYTVQAGVRDRFIVKTAKEVRNATPQLVTCPVGAVGVRMLNDAALCARGDSASACGDGQPVRKP